jgi:hypothetical protein
MIEKLKINIFILNLFLLLVASKLVKKNRFKKLAFFERMIKFFSLSLNNIYKNSSKYHRFISFKVFYLFYNKIFKTNFQ